MSDGHVNAGDPIRIRSADWNDMLEISRQGGADQDWRRRGGGGGAILATSPTTALARNTGGTDIARWGVVKVGAPIILPADNVNEWGAKLAVDVASPTTLPAGTWLAVATTPIKAGKIGRIAIGGVTQCLLNVIDAGHGSAGALAGDTTLRSMPRGPCTIIWRESGTGSGKRAIVHIGTASIVEEVTGWLIGTPTALAGTTNQWEYPWEEVEYHTTIRWRTRSGGLSSAGGEPKALNSVEANNQGSARESAGVDIAATATSTATLLEIGKGSTKPVYRMWRQPIVGGDPGAYRWVFSEGNEIDVACVE